MNPPSPSGITDEDVRERLQAHRELLEKIAEMNVPASEDAERALAFLDGEGQS